MKGAFLRFAGGVASRWLHDRRLARAPLALYRLGLGRLLGSRMLMLEHRGRRTGRVRRAVLEAIDRPAPRTFRVLSGLGPRANWYRNVVADPRCRVSNGRLRRSPATAYPVPQSEVPAALEKYAAANPRGWQVLERAMSMDVPPGLTLGQFLPMVDLVLDDVAEDTERGAGGRLVGRG